jgi:hypothetical protein
VLLEDLHLVLLIIGIFLFLIVHLDLILMVICVGVAKVSQQLCLKVWFRLHVTQGLRIVV